MTLSLTDVVDLEVRLHLDRDADPDLLHARDRALGIDPSGGDTATTLGRWLAALRPGDGSRSVGQQVALAARLATLGVVVTGFVLGWGTTSALFAYDGERPINVLPYVGVVVGLQAAAALVSVLGLVVSRAAPGLLRAMPLWEDLRFVARGLLRLVIDRVARGQHAHGEVAALLGRVRGRHGLYAPLETWLAFGLVQAFGVAVNLGVLANALRLVSFTDLAFGWGTTLDLGAEAFHGVLTVLSWPFAALLPSAVPSEALVQTTQFSRLGRAFAEPAGALLAPAWWRFIVAATVAWGLVPRVLLQGVSRLGLARARRQVPLDTPEVARVLARLGTPRMRARTLDDATAAPGLPADPGARAVAALGPTLVVRWGDVPGEDGVLTALLRSGLQADVAAIHRAGGKAYEADRSTLDALAGLPAGHGVVVVAEVFDEPDRAMRHFLTQVREQVGAGVRITVALVDDLTAPRPVAARDRTRWRSMLGVLGDPYLDVVTLGDRP